MGGIEDVGMEELKCVGKLLRKGAILCECLCADLLEVGNHYGSRMGYHENFSLKTNGG